VFVPLKMTPRQLQQGFINLVSRTFDYANIAKRMKAIYVDTRQREVKLALPLWLEKAFYRKLHFTLNVRQDYEAMAFLEDLRPHVFAGEIPMASVLLQIDQHDWAVRNTLTMSEHRYNLDVPAWQDRALAETAGAGTGLAAEIAAQVR
jgi:hypothetical protein